MLRFIGAALVMALSLLAVSQAQRPAFSGLRPPGGLSQKDKYHATANTAVENITGVDIATRFGESSSPQQPNIINLAYGATQRPPIGVPLVLPTSGVVQAPVPSSAVPDVANRFGAADATTSTANTPILSAASPTASSATPTAAGSTTATWTNLPVDAHGDREWVNHLSQLPVESQPFWFLNYQAIEAHRNSSRPNVGATETRGSFFRG
ncbi:hypothetical protein KR018_007610 [Drosophila ironensis]|nr:hypothetical protein KR018_007610 [Drosophila ironensis]